MSSSPPPAPRKTKEPFNPIPGIAMFTGLFTTIYAVVLAAKGEEWRSLGMGLLTFIITPLAMYSRTETFGQNIRSYFSPFLFWLDWLRMRALALGATVTAMGALWLAGYQSAAKTAGLVGLPVTFYAITSLLWAFIKD